VPHVAQDLASGPSTDEGMACRLLGTVRGPSAASGDDRHGDEVAPITGELRYATTSEVGKQ
jgi:hypothetical protein